MTDQVGFLNFAEAREIAKRRLPRGIFEYIDRGAEDERALAGNRAAFDRIKIKPYALRSGSNRSTTISLFGHEYCAPLVVTPTAFAGLVYFNGEVELAKAAAEFGIPFTAATEAITSIAAVARATSVPIWFQLYLWDKEEISFELMDKAWSSGVRTIVVTVDTPVLPNREFNVRNGFDVPLRFALRNVFDVAMHPRWALGVFGRYVVTEGVPTFANYPDQYRKNLLRRDRGDPLDFMPNLSWDHMGRIRDRWKGTMVIKGLLRQEDALEAKRVGADGIVVSNHGGRNLDSAIAPIDVLRGIVDCVGPAMTVLADSSVQRGSDVFKLLASGAKAVLLGRSMLYGTAAGGKAGAIAMMRILKEELARTMDMSGCQTIADVNQDMIAAS
ncbi:alpha-hydroxy-acid oxidizing protein [Mesorhizobium sp. M7A.F.Ca.US.006.01.1.1]|uniref:alpha-hydroxy acid oxidase n=1 Tax=Mesorhizobium sp. M7A.F.Ca.US.006.01.1.1 TaxID=2496707 RepID=UPI000FCAE4C0|nr:alpha-hydroxy acid oxidase [Mesorhizobium sp. M7A.F.Ca.US.006.01.1.1]RUZ79397.1 alpha-hydroxy-acid oxidizing protein [Mesorhizobium sp. M7A.F.Ca.US.006.01.1.1]